MADISTSNELTARQFKAITALISEPSIRKASEVSGIPERTIYTWLKNGDFNQAYRSARRDATQQAIAVLQGYSSHAARTLIALLVDQNHTLRFQAAKTILEFALESLDRDDLMQRLEALEAKNGK